MIVSTRETSPVGPTRRLGEVLYKALARALSPVTARALDVSVIKRLLILQLQQLGDSVVFTPALRAIRRRFPSAEIDLLCSPVSFDFYKKCQSVNEVFVDRSRHGRRRDWRLYLETVSQLRRRRYDAVVADATQTAAIYPFTAFLTGARHRIGFDANSRGFLFTTRLRCPDTIDVIEANLRLARLLGAATPSRDVDCFFDEGDEAHASALLASLSGRHPLVAIHPASNWQSKTWYTERWATIADRLTDQYGASVLFVGTERERGVIEEIQDATQHATLSVAGKTDLPQLAALLAQCDLFIGTDSGPRHIASAVGISQATLMSSLDLRSRWVFARESEHVIRTDPACSPCLKSYCSHRSCMAAITEGMVMAACERLLAGAQTLGDAANTVSTNSIPVATPISPSSHA